MLFRPSSPALTPNMPVALRQVGETLPHHLFHQISSAHLRRTSPVFQEQLYHSMEQLQTKIPNPDPTPDQSLQLKPVFAIEHPQ